MKWFWFRRKMLHSFAWLFCCINKKFAAVFVSGVCKLSITSILLIAQLAKFELSLWSQNRNRFLVLKLL